MPRRHPGRGMNGRLLSGYSVAASVEMRNQLAEQHRRVSALLQKTEQNLEIYFSSSHSLSNELWNEIHGYLGAVRQAGAMEVPDVSGEIKAAMEDIGPFPVFVGGAHKSGTTLVRNLLDGHRDLFVLPTDGRGYGWVSARRGREKTEYQAEALDGLGVTLIQPIAGTGPTWIAGSGYEPYVDIAGYYHYWGNRLPDDAKGRLLNSVYALYCQELRCGGRKKRLWVDKSTDNVLNVMSLIDAFPHARFIHIVRHPAAIVAAQKRKQPLKGRTFKLQNEIRSAGTMMDHATRNSRRYGKSVYRVVRYEDLIQDTRGVMQDIAEFLQIPFEECLLRPTVYGILAGSNTAYTDRAPAPGTVGKASGELWEQVLSAAEVRVIAQILGPELREHGYGAPAVGPLTMLASLLALKVQYAGSANHQPISILRWTKYCLGVAIRRRRVDPGEKNIAPMNRE